MDREPVAGVAHGRCRDIAKRHGAIFCQYLDPGIRRGRHHGAGKSDRNLAAIFVDILLEVGRFRPPAETADGHDLAGFRMIENNRSDPGDWHQIRLHNTERNARRDPGVKRITARFENFISSFRREVMPCRDHVMIGFDGRLQ